MTMRDYMTIQIVLLVAAVALISMSAFTITGPWIPLLGFFLAVISFIVGIVGKALTRPKVEDKSDV